jgi:4-carboxymuconolactone decarboxylase
MESAMTGSGLGAESRTLVRISVALAAGEPRDLRDVLEEGARLEDPEKVEEVILQSYLFLGYPAALNAFGLWREVSGRDPGYPCPEDWEGWGQRGEEVCRTVYGGQYEGLRRNVRALHPDMERWMVVEGYGKVLGRPGLDLTTRELCIAALLAVLRAPRQLYSHLRGALNAGADPAAVEEVLDLACARLGEERTEQARAVWTQVQARALADAVSIPSSAG